MKNEMSPVGTQLLRLPLQAAPIERTLAADQPLSIAGSLPFEFFLID
jgi:hypothetical protein